MEHEQHECGCGGSRLDRRGMLARLMFSALSLLGLGALAGCPGGSKYRQAKALAQAAGNPASGWQDRLEFDKRKCHQGESLELELNGVKLIAVRNADTKARPVWTAVDRRCTHNRCLVSFDVAANEFVCPCHGSRFSFTGEPLSGPAHRALTDYRIEEGPLMVTVYENQPVGSAPANAPTQAAPPRHGA
jgi:Rieske Fe-S protein